MDKRQEILDLLQEECAEVIQAISKVRRFGLDANYKEGGSQRAHLAQEIGDVLLLIDLLISSGVVSDELIQQAKSNKADKLKTWSNIYG